MSKLPTMAGDPGETGIEEAPEPEATQKPAEGKKRPSPFVEEDEESETPTRRAEEEDDEYEPEPARKPKRRSETQRQEPPPVDIGEIESRYRTQADSTAHAQAQAKLRALAEELSQIRVPEDLPESRLAEMTDSERMNYMLARQRADIRREQIRRDADHLFDETEHKRHLYHTQATQAIDMQRRAYSIWPELAAKIWEDIRTKPIDQQLQWNTYSEAADKARGRAVNDQIFRKRLRDQNRASSVAGRSGAGGGGEMVFDVSPEEKSRLVSMGLKGKSLERAMTNLRSPGRNR